MSATFHVIATTIDGTAAALRAVTLLATKQQARVVLLVPQTAADAEQSPHSINRLIARYDDMARDLNQPVRIRVCMSPNVVEAVTRMTSANSTVLIGGRTGVFWPGAEERLAARLRRSGREVVFVGCNERSAVNQELHVDA